MMEDVDIERNHFALAAALANGQPMPTDHSQYEIKLQDADILCDIDALLFHYMKKVSRGLTEESSYLWHGEMTDGDNAIDEYIIYFYYDNSVQAIRLRFAIADLMQFASRAFFNCTIDL
jgi:hypothetical protein